MHTCSFEIIVGYRQFKYQFSWSLDFTSVLLKNRFNSEDIEKVSHHILLCPVLCVCDKSFNPLNHPFSAVRDSGQRILTVPVYLEVFLLFCNL